MHTTILPSLLLLLMPLGASAQFYTISKASDSVQVLSFKKIETIADEHVCEENIAHNVRMDSLPPLVAVKEKQMKSLLTKLNMRYFNSANRFAKYLNKNDYLTSYLKNV